MRKIQTQDIFNAFRIIKKANIREEIKPLLILAGNKKLKTEEIGITGFLTIFEALAEKNAEHAIYDFLSGPFEMEAKEIRELPLDELVPLLESMAKENDLKSFFSRLGGLIGLKS